jgi:hypothetical protein
VVPGYIAALFVHRRGVSAKLAYQEVQGVLQARGELLACAHVLIWLRAACTARGGGEQQMERPAYSTSWSQFTSQLRCIAT